MHLRLRRSPHVSHTDGDVESAGIAGQHGAFSATIAVLLAALVSIGCRSGHPAPKSLVEANAVTLHADADVRARCPPPADWQAKPLELFPRSVQRVWLSPTGRTAYGVIYIRLPLPVGPDLVLWRFIADMREMEGDGRLISRERSDDGELRFVAENPRYRFNARLHTAGRDAWIIYAGVERDQPPDAAEFSLAESARDATVHGLAPTIR